MNLYQRFVESLTGKKADASRAPIDIAQETAKERYARSVHQARLRPTLKEVRVERRATKPEFARR